MVGNCDEFYVCLMVVLVFWQDEMFVIGGCDLCFGGGWVGVGVLGWMVVVINVCDLLVVQIGLLWGVLVVDFLCGCDLVVVYIDCLVIVVGVYVLFNFLLVDSDSLEYLGNYFVEWQMFGLGVYGMFNGVLDVFWLKIWWLMVVFEVWFEVGDEDLILFWVVLVDEYCFVDSDLFDIGIGLECECWLSLVFIRGDDYGICVSMVLLIDVEGYGQIYECCFGFQGVVNGQSYVIF